MHQRKKKLLRNFHVPRKEKLLTKCHTSKKGKTSGKMSCLKNIYNRKIRPLTMCHASNSTYLISIWSLERISSQFFPRLANVFSCLWIISDNAFLHLRHSFPCAFILLSSSRAFSLKSLHRRELRAMLRHSATRAEYNIDLGMLLSK